MRMYLALNDLWKFCEVQLNEKTIKYYDYRAI